MTQAHNAVQANFGLIYGYVDSFISKDIRREQMIAGIRLLRRDPTTPTAWADFDDCLSMILDRAVNASLSAEDASALIMRILAAA